MEDEERIDEPVVYDDLVDKHTDELMELLDNRNMKALRERMDEMQEFDVAEFLSSLEDNRMPMLFRLLSKEKAAGTVTLPVSDLTVSASYSLLGR